MIVTEKFIWKEDHFAFHITEEKNMLSIMEKGLLPLNGERCMSVWDDRIGVFCLDDLHYVQLWAQTLFESQKLETLKLLRFNLKRRKWYLDDSNPDALGIYLPKKVLPEKISYLDITDQEGNQQPLTKLFDLDLLYKINSSLNRIENDKQLLVDDCSLSWKPITKYQRIRKK